MFRTFWVKAGHPNVYPCYYSNGFSQLIPYKIQQLPHSTVPPNHPPTAVMRPPIPPTAFHYPGVPNPGTIMAIDRIPSPSGVKPPIWWFTTCIQRVCEPFRKGLQTLAYGMETLCKGIVNYCFQPFSRKEVQQKPSLQGSGTIKCFTVWWQVVESKLSDQLWLSFNDARCQSDKDILEKFHQQV